MHTLETAARALLERRLQYTTFRWISLNKPLKGREWIAPLAADLYALDRAAARSTTVHPALNFSSVRKRGHLIADPIEPEQNDIRQTIQLAPWDCREWFGEYDAAREVWGRRLRHSAPFRCTECYSARSTQASRVQPLTMTSAKRNRSMLCDCRPMVRLGHGHGLPTPERGCIRGAPPREGSGSASPIALWVASSMDAYITLDEWSPFPHLHFPTSSSLTSQLPA
jgi:hypothetical protein